MLNYVWLGLLVLGIGTALVTDISNQSSDKYRNNEPFRAEILLQNKTESAGRGTYSGSILVDKSRFNRFYSVHTDTSVQLPVSVTLIPDDNKGTLVIDVDKSAPEIWQRMANASGEKNELSGKFTYNAETNNKLNAKVILASVSFLKLKDITNAALDYAGTAVNIAIGLIGIMALWLGVMKVAEEAGLISLIARWLRPIMRRLFPDVPEDHPAMGSMIMNISANMLGLGNAATPFGLKAMEELDELNPNKGTATNSMVTFLAINTAGLTLIPATAIAVRAAAGSSDPAIIIGTSIFGAACATTAGITAAKVLQQFPVKEGFFNWLKLILREY